MFIFHSLHVRMCRQIFSDGVVRRQPMFPYYISLAYCRLGEIVSVLFLCVYTFDVISSIPCFFK